MAQQPRKLLVLDIDNTVFDWVTYYVHSMESLFSTVSDIVGTSSTQLANEAKQVFTEHGSIEYPFLIQELPSVIEFYSGRIEQMLKEAVEPGREAFNRAAQNHLMPYEGVVSTLRAIRQRWPGLPVIALMTRRVT